MRFFQNHDDDAQARRVYVAAQDGVIGSIDLNTMEKLPEIKLPGHPEAFAIEMGGRRLFVNVPKTDSVLVIDRSKAEVVGRWQLTKAKGNYTMAFDEAHGRLFVGCRNPASVVLDGPAPAFVSRTDGRRGPRRPVFPARSIRHPANTCRTHERAFAAAGSHCPDSAA